MECVRSLLMLTVMAWSGVQHRIRPEYGFIHEGGAGSRTTSVFRSKGQLPWLPCSEVIHQGLKLVDGGKSVSCECRLGKRRVYARSC